MYGTSFDAHEESPQTPSKNLNIAIIILKKFWS